MSDARINRDSSCIETAWRSARSYEASDSVPLRCVVSTLPLIAAPSEMMIAGAEIPPSIEAVALTTIFVVADSSPLKFP